VIEMRAIAPPTRRASGRRAPRGVVEGAVACLLLALTFGAAQGQTSLPVKIAPPESKFEPQPPRPSESHFWMPGHWRWIGGTWVWTKGRWLESPSPGMYWLPGHWEQRPYGYVWTDGGWVLAEP
jgi:hypothetical protein